MGELAEAVEHELQARGSRCPSFTTHMFTGFGQGELDSGTETARMPIPEGTSVMFDFGGVVDGYCSDFGRTIYCGEPTEEYREVYDVMLAAQEAGRAAAARARRPARSTRPAAGRSRTPGSASTSATAWATASAWTSTSARSCPRRTRRRSSPA